MNLDVTSEFIVMASRLIYLKSKSLLPSVVEDEEDEEIDLVKMLIEYKKYKEFTFTLKERIQTFGGKYYKMPDKIEFAKEKLNESYESDLITSIYKEIVTKETEKKNINADNINRLVVAEKVTIKSKIKDILKELWKKPSFIFNKVFNLKKSSKVEVVTAFLGLLELSRMSRIEVNQSALFGDISVTKLKKEK
jgi:segregation and condensation protein A